MSVSSIAALTNTFTANVSQTSADASGSGSESADASSSESLTSAVTAGSSGADVLDLSSGIDGLMDHLERELLAGVTEKDTPAAGESESDVNVGEKLNEHVSNELGASLAEPAADDAAGSAGTSLDTTA